MNVHNINVQNTDKGKWVKQKRFKNPKNESKWRGDNAKQNQKTKTQGYNINKMEILGV